MFFCHCFLAFSLVHSYSFSVQSTHDLIKVAKTCLSLCTICRSPTFLPTLSISENLSMQSNKNLYFCQFPEILHDNWQYSWWWTENFRFTPNQQNCIWNYPFRKYADSRMCNHVWSLNYSWAVSGPREDGRGTGAGTRDTVSVTSHYQQTFMTDNNDTKYILQSNKFYLNPALPLTHPCNFIKYRLWEPNICKLCPLERDYQ